MCLQTILRIDFTRTLKVIISDWNKAEIKYKYWIFLFFIIWFNKLEIYNKWEI